VAIQFHFVDRSASGVAIVVQRTEGLCCADRRLNGWVVEIDPMKRSGANPTAVFDLGGVFENVKIEIMVGNCSRPIRPR
jgi:hypothetical protein